MKILFAGNNQRGVDCLKFIKNKYDIVGVIGNKKTSNQNYFVKEAQNLKFNVFQPDNVNDSDFIKKLKHIGPDVIVLAGYSQIVKRDFISIGKKACINLHAGELPKYRGSSPLNWALLNGENSFKLTIINVDEGIDSGDILIQKNFKIDDESTIEDLHEIANNNFPKLLNIVLTQIKNKEVNTSPQNAEFSSYYPLRFPSDGIVFFDQNTAEQIHNKIRALRPPYPGVITYYNNKKIKIVKSSLTKKPYFGEPGRIYKISKTKGLLVCALDRCLWIEEVYDNESNLNEINNFERYEKFATIKEVAERFYDNQ